MVHSAQAVHLSCSNTKTLQTDRNEILHDPGHPGVVSGVSKAIFEPVVRSTQTEHLPCIKNSTNSKRTKTNIHFSLVNLEVPSGAFKIISEPTVRLAQTVQLSYTDTNTVSKRTKMRFHMTPHHPGVLSGVSKMIFEPVVCSALNHAPILRQA
jgi:hypothetical protein